MTSFIPRSRKLLFSSGIFRPGRTHTQSSTYHIGGTRTIQPLHKTAMRDRASNEGTGRDDLQRGSGSALERVVGRRAVHQSTKACRSLGTSSSIPARRSAMRLLDGKDGMVHRILRVPAVISSDGTSVPTENVVVFSVGAIDVCTFGGSGGGTDLPSSANVELSFTLTANGYRAQSALTSTFGTVREMPSMLQQGISFAFDKKALEYAVLTLKVMRDRQVVAEHAIPVQTLLKGSRRDFFHETIAFAMALQDRSENCNQVPEVAAAKHAVAVRGPLAFEPVRTLKDFLGRKCCDAAISLGMFKGPGLSKGSTKVPSVKLAFEILSVGDKGKLRLPNDMHFLHLELAQDGRVVFSS